jgi:hypothetical protein
MSQWQHFMNPHENHKLLNGFNDKLNSEGPKYPIVSFRLPPYSTLKMLSLLIIRSR